MTHIIGQRSRINCTMNISGWAIALKGLTPISAPLSMPAFHYTWFGKSNQDLSLVGLVSCLSSS